MAAGVLLGLLGAVSAASADDTHCEVRSDDDLTLNPRSLILIRESDTPQRLVVRRASCSSTTAGWNRKPTIAPA